MWNIPFLWGVVCVWGHCQIDDLLYGTIDCCIRTVDEVVEDFLLLVVRDFFEKIVSFILYRLFDHRFKKKRGRKGEIAQRTMEPALMKRCKHSQLTIPDRKAQAEDSSTCSYIQKTRLNARLIRDVSVSFENSHAAMTCLGLRPLGKLIAQSQSQFTDRSKYQKYVQRTGVCTEEYLQDLARDQMDDQIEE